MSNPLLCACPKAASLTAISSPTCSFKMEQVVRLSLVRYSETVYFDSDAGTPNPITALASWTAAKAETDDNKHIISPLFSNLVIPSSEALEEGGNDNTTVNGIPVYLGEGVVQVTGFFRNLEPTLKDELNELVCESDASATGTPQLGAYFVNRAGNIFHKTESALPNDPLPVGIYNFRLGTRGTEGFAKDDIIPFSFYLDADWDDSLAVTKRTALDFNPLTQL